MWLSGILSVRCGWDEVIVKPCVSASSHRTHRVLQQEADAYQVEFEAMARESGALVQPFMREIQESGEWSFVFFDRKFSHAVLKKPADGDYRTQESFGGSAIRATPSDAQVKAAADVVALVEGDLLYSRVDMVQVKDQLLLGELELIEPFLFFTSEPGSTLRFARALASKAKFSDIKPQH